MLEVCRRQMGSSRFVWKLAALTFVLLVILKAFQSDQFYLHHAALVRLSNYDSSETPKNYKANEKYVQLELSCEPPHKMSANAHGFSCSVRSNLHISVKDLQVTVHTEKDGTIPVYLVPMIPSDPSETSTKVKFLLNTESGYQHTLSTHGKIKVTVILGNQVAIAYTQRVCRIALSLYGRVCCWNFEKRTPNGGDFDERVLDIGSANIYSNFILPNEAAGCIVDVFAVSWAEKSPEETQYKEKKIRDYYNPVAVELVEFSTSKMKDAPFPSAHHSEIAMDLIDEHAKGHGVVYTFAVNMRYDIYFYRPFLIENLSTDLLYTSNWCRPNGETLTWPSSGRFKCRALGHKGIPADNHEHNAVPDYWTAGSPEVMSIYWNGFSEGYLNGSWKVENDIVIGHTMYGTRLWTLINEGRLYGAGKFLYHQQDYTHYRQANPCALPWRAVIGKLAWWWKNEGNLDPVLNPAYDYRLPRDQNSFSYCGDKEGETPLYFCWSKIQEVTGELEHTWAYKTGDEPSPNCPLDSATLPHD